MFFSVSCMSVPVGLFVCLSVAPSLPPRRDCLVTELVQSFDQWRQFVSKRSCSNFVVVVCCCCCRCCQSNPPVLFFVFPLCVQYSNQTKSKCQLWLLILPCSTGCCCCLGTVSLWHSLCWTHQWVKSSVCGDHCAELRVKLSMAISMLNSPVSKTVWVCGDRYVGSPVSKTVSLWWSLCWTHHWVKLSVCGRDHYAELSSE